MSDNKMYEKYPMPHIPTKEEIEDTQTNQEYVIRTMNDWKKKSAQDLDRFLEEKLENYVGEMFWLQNAGKILITSNGDIDEITMQGEFNEEIDIVKGWIKEWKSDGKLEQDLHNSEIDLKRLENLYGLKDCQEDILRLKGRIELLHQLIKEQNNEWE